SPTLWLWLFLLRIPFLIPLLLLLIGRCGRVVLLRARSGKEYDRIALAHGCLRPWLLLCLPGSRLAGGRRRCLVCGPERKDAAVLREDGCLVREAGSDLGRDIRDAALAARA